MTGLLDKARLLRVADGCAIGVAAALPWSTSVTLIFIALWAVAVIAMFEVRALRDVVLTPAGGLPVLLFALGVLGMLWADVDVAARIGGVDSFLKLLAIPLLMVHFQRSDNGLWVFASFVISCAALLIVTTIAISIPQLAAAYVHMDNVIVKNAATQSGLFVLCIFGLLYVAKDCVDRRQWLGFGVIVALMLGMLGNMAFFSVGRTPIAMIPVLLLVFIVKRLSGKAVIIALVGSIAIAAVTWMSAPYLRYRTIAVWTETQDYLASDKQNSSGERLAFYKSSLAFIADAPLIGHGTGTIPKLFAEITAGKTGASGSSTTNPHNQTLAVAIQLGLMGTVVLFALWFAHLCLFRGGGLVAWVGLIVVVQNVIGSLFNSHLFDFVQGWLYVFGVGVAGGMLLRRRLGAGASVTS